MLSSSPTTPIARGLELPPGPPGLPLIGNLLDAPALDARIATAAKWADEYGSHPRNFATMITYQNYSK